MALMTLAPAFVSWYDRCLQNLERHAGSNRTSLSGSYSCANATRASTEGGKLNPSP